MAYIVTYKQLIDNVFQTIYFRTSAEAVGETGTLKFLRPNVNTINDKSFSTTGGITLYGSDIKRTSSSSSTIATDITNLYNKILDSSTLEGDKVVDILDFNTYYGSNILDVSALGYYLDNVRNYISSNQMASSTSSGLMSASDKKNLDALVGLLQEDSDTVINTIQEVLDAFKNASEGFNIVSVLAGKLDKSYILTGEDVTDFDSWGSTSISISNDHVLSSYALSNILENFAPRSMVPKVTIGANAPTSNKNGDIWFDTNTPS